MINYVFKFGTVPVSLASVGMAIAAAETLSARLMYAAAVFAGIAACSVLIMVSRNRRKDRHIRLEGHPAVKSH